MIHLITYFTNTQNIIESLKYNLKNNLIDKIHLYVDTIESLNIILDLNIQNKIKIILLENKIPNFSEIFNYIKDRLNNEICLIMNSNLYLLNDNNNIINKLKNNLILYKYDAVLFNPIYYNNFDCLINSIKVYNNSNEINLIKIGNINYSLIEYKKKYVIFRPCGRLGNALFRYFASIIYCIEYNYDFILEDDCKDICKDYIYYDGIDYVNHDILMKEFNLDEFKNIANNNHYIEGFNTLGYFKNNIDVTKLIETEYINKKKSHGIYVKNILTINDNNFYNYINDDLSNCDLIENNHPLTNHHLLMDGYFQFDNIYLDKKKEIIDFLKVNKYNHYIKTATYNRILSDNHQNFLIDTILNFNLNKDKIYDIVIHLRLGDFKEYDDFIEYIYMEKLFESIDFFYNKKISIVLQKPDNKEDEEYLDKCIQWFKNTNIYISIESNDVITDFHIMKNAKILICSMSTLSWCAAYLSDTIQKCYMPNYNFLNRSTSFKYPIKNTVLYDIKTSFI
jgi:hypothetical protein